MRFVVIGAGAIGGSIGGYLAGAGNEVVFVEKSPATEKAVKEKGLIVRGLKGEHNLKVPIVSSSKKVKFRDDDVVILATKCYDTQDALNELYAAGGSSLPILCAQNGVRNEELAAEYSDRVYGVMIMMGVTSILPGIVYHTSGGRLGLGAYPEGGDDLLDQVIASLNAAKVEAVATERIMESKWTKLLQNLNNASFAMTDLSVQEGLSYPEMRLWVADVIEEGANALKAAGVKCGTISGQPMPEESVAQLRSDGFQGPPLASSEEMKHRPSLWQDLHMKRGWVESPFFNGEIVASGERAGIPTPLNSMLLRESLRLAAERAEPGGYTIKQLRDMAKRG